MLGSLETVKHMLGLLFLGGGKYSCPQAKIFHSAFPIAVCCALMTKKGDRIGICWIQGLTTHGHRRSDEDCGYIKIHWLILMLHNQRVNDVRSLTCHVVCLLVKALLLVLCNLYLCNIIHTHLSLWMLCWLSVAVVGQVTPRPCRTTSCPTHPGELPWQE